MLFSEYFAKLMDHVTRRPDAVAIVCQKQMVTFGQLGRRVAAMLDRLSSHPHGVVLIQGHKEPDAIAAMIAATLSSRGFVFADNAYPQERVSDIIATCDASVVIQTGHQTKQCRLPTILAKDVAGIDLDPTLALPTDESGTFYITFTSGSTGKPKGIPISRANFCALVSWIEAINSDSRGGHRGHINQANLAFDMSMSDIWPTLFDGRPVFLLEQSGISNPRVHLRQMIGDINAIAGVMVAAPAFYAVMLEDPKFSCVTLPDLKTFWIGGESAPKSVLVRLLERFPDAEIFHGYGPSEAACISHLHKLSSEDIFSDKGLPLGQPRGKMRVYVQESPNSQLAEIGSGEIILSGPQVASGYLPRNHPNNDKFWADENKRFYRTGDWGTIDAGGNLTVSGRIDNQIKVNGYRIELPEIELRAAEISGVDLAVALEDRNNGQRGGIVLFMQGAIGLDVVQDHLRACLPAYMQPARYILRKKLPLSTGGKIDRRALEKILAAEIDPHLESVK